jgi:hypothetical protein
LYYTEYLLPIYIEAVNNACCRHDEQANWLLIEDRDLLYRMKKYSIARELKDTNWITNLKHPVQSPDLNPIEGIWNIIKQRLHRRIFYSSKELKDAIQEEWDKITLEEIRARIGDMPRRCDLLVKTGGQAIKSAMW